MFILFYELLNEAEAELDSLGGGGESLETDSSSNTSTEISAEDQMMESIKSEDGYQDDEATFWGKDSKQSDTKEGSPKKEGVDHNEDNLDAEEMLKKLAGDGKEDDVEDADKGEKGEEKEPEVPLFHELKHKEETVKVEKNSEYETELLQKGLDYTKKTQTLADERKVFDDEKGVINKLHEERTKSLEDNYKNFESIVQDNQILEQAIPLLKERYPDSFEELTECFQEASRVQDSPAMRVLKSQINSLQDQIKESNEKFNSITNNAELETINSNYTKEVEAVKAEFSPMLKKIGLNVDHDKVTEVWKNGEATKMTYKQALLSLYAEPINKLYASRAKVSDAERRASVGKVKGVGSFNKSKGTNQVSTSKTLDDFERNWEQEIASFV